MDGYSGEVETQMIRFLIRFASGTVDVTRLLKLRSWGMGVLPTSANFWTAIRKRSNMGCRKSKVTKLLI